MPHLKEALEMYSSHLLSIIAVALFILLPLYVLDFFANAGIQYYFYAHDLEGIGIFTSLLVTFMIIVISQVPFIALGAKAIINEKIQIRGVLGSFFKYLLPLIGSTLLFMLAMIFGLFLLIIPGVIMFFLTLLHPYVAIIDNKSGKELLMKTVEWGKKSLVDIAVFFIMIISVNLLLWWIFASGAFLVTEQVFTFIALRVLVNILLVPLFVFIVTAVYYERSPESFDRLEEAATS